MIPLDHQFNELLNETIPFPLPQAPPKVVPKPVNVSKPKTQPESSPTKLRIAPTPPKAGESPAVMLDAPVTFTACSFDCYHDVATDLTSSCDSEQAEIAEDVPAVKETPVVEKNTSQSTVRKVSTAKVSSVKTQSLSSIAEQRSKVEISAEQSVPFEIDTRMMINRPRLTLKESGLPVPLSPEEPDPSIVGESILGIKQARTTATPSKELLEEKQQIQSRVSEEILDLLEQNPAVSEKPILKAFNPTEPVVDEEALQEMPESETDTWQEEEAIDEYLYENSCEMEDDEGFEEYAIAQQECLEGPGEAATAEEKTTDEKFYPMLQVDRYAWPDFCHDMHPIIQTQLGHLGEQLIAKSATGRNVIAVVGSGPKSGSTSILLGLAKALKTTGQNVAIVDANINTPHLASSLGLQPEQGWETVLSGELSVEESLIDSIEDNIALLPLCLDESEKITFGVRPNETDRMNEAMQKVKKYYDLVLVDLGSPEAADIAAFSNMSEWIDSAVVVHNLRDGSRGQLIKMKNLMRDYGVSVAGVAENFAPREAYTEETEYRAA